MPLRIKLDENLPKEIAELLNAHGHDAVTVADQRWSGLSDDILWQRLQSEGRALVTADKEFGDIRLYPPGTHAGIILLRARQEGLDSYLDLTAKEIVPLSIDQVAGAVVVVTERGSRVRRNS